MSTQKAPVTSFVCKIVFWSEVLTLYSEVKNSTLSNLVSITYLIFYNVLMQKIWFIRLSTLQYFWYRRHLSRSAVLAMKNSWSRQSAGRADFVPVRWSSLSLNSPPIHELLHRVGLHLGYWIYSEIAFIKLNKYWVQNVLF